MGRRLSCPVSGPAPDPLATGPKIDYEFKVYWPDEGGNETSCGRLSARQLAAEFRDLADKLEEYDEQVAVDASLAGDTEWDREHRLRGGSS